MAVGASRWDVSWMFLKKGFLQLAIGSAIGVPAALALGILARFQLVEVEPTDPVTFAGIILILATVAAAACLIPVRRAAHVDPVHALRAE
jgi:ABC-type antimicrobial peptide transport system permease subunit